jgi:hypothetical protein
MESYIKSAAVNRHHYALTHKVESATSVQEAEAAVRAEVDRIRANVARGMVRSRQTSRLYLTEVSTDRCTRRTHHSDVL